MKGHLKLALLGAVALLTAIALTVGAADAAAPTVTVGATSQVGVTSALAKGTVNPEEKETNCHFDYIAAAQFGQNPSEPFEGSTQAPCTGNPLNGNTPQPVEAELTGLLPATTYHLRLVAENSEGEHAEESAPTFTTMTATIPTLGIPATSTVTYTSAKLENSIDPDGGNSNPGEATPLPVEWQLQFAPLAEPEPRNWQNANPEGEDPIGSVVPSQAASSSAIPVSAEAEGLTNGTEYAYRVLATYAGGLQSESAPPGVFTTLIVTRPSVTIDDSFGVTATAALFAGTVKVLNPDPAFTASCQFQYVTEQHFEAPGEEGGFAQAASVPCAPETVAGAEPPTPTPVTAEASGLEPNTTYHLRIVATNAGGQEAATAEDTFTTSQAEPTALATTNTPESQGEVLLRGAVNPRNSTVTDCHFAWGPASGGFEHSVPCVGNAGGLEPPVPTPIEGGEPQLVTAKLSGLTAGFSGHFKVVIATSGGTVASEPVPFTTFAAPEIKAACPNEARREEQDPGGTSATSLPECRAWELVSPPAKNGGDVVPEASRTRSSTDGDAASFISLEAFGDAHGTGITSEYLSRREGVGADGGRGWSTHAILPQLEPVSTSAAGSGLTTTYGGEFSPDLAAGVLRTYTNLTNDPDVEGVDNLYLRTDLLSAGAGSYRLLTGCARCAETGPLPPQEGARGAQVAASTPDLGQVLFGDRSDLVQGASGSAPKLYEWDHGTVRLVGIRTDAECAELGEEPGCAAGRSSAGVGASQTRYTPSTLSSDGRKAFFTIAPNGVQLAGNIYMRLDHTETVQLNLPEREPCLAEPQSPECEPQPARYQTATPDGSTVFFTSAAQLTEVSGGGLYAYDTTKSSEDPQNLTLIAPGVGSGETGVVGVGGDGGYVYFTVDRQLLVGAPPFHGSGLYLWHDGKVIFIGLLSDPSNTDGTIDDVLGGNYGLVKYGARITPDGTHLLFVSHNGAGLTGDDQDSGCENGEILHEGELGSRCVEIYLYDATSEALTCVSCNPAGAPAKADASFDASGLLTSAASGSHLNHPISDDGRLVFFTSPERLVPEDTDGTRDVYAYDTLTGRLSLLSSGQSDDDSVFLEASPDGRNIFFTSRQRLLGWDTDGGDDLYDARVDGGFPEPAPIPASCGGSSSCRTGAPAPGARAPGSQGFSGPGDPSPSRGCRKGKTKRRGRCVARKAKKGHHHRHSDQNKRRADNNEGRGTK
jgi:hypothetical protein